MTSTNGGTTAVLDRHVLASCSADPIDGGELEGRLEAALSLMSRCEVSELPVVRLEVLVALVRRAERGMAGLLARLAARARALAELGIGPGNASLLTGHGQVSAATVRADTARSLAVEALPRLGAALATGEVGVDHVDLVAGVWARASDAERTELSGVDDELAEAAARLSVESFDRRVHRAMARIRQQLGPQAAAAKQSELRWWWGRDNMGRLSGQLTAEQYERVAAALGAEMAELVRQNDAPGPGAPAVALDARLAALTALYATCAWYDCDRPVDWCQAHHVVFWEQLGPTNLGNLVPLCNHRPTRPAP